MIHFQYRSRYIWYSSSLSSTHICSSLVMNRQGISSPVFHNNDGANNYIIKASIFDLQRQMQGAQSRLREHIDNLAINMRHFELRTRDYLDNKLSAQKEEEDGRMEEIRTLLINHSSASSSSRRWLESRSSSERPCDASSNRPRPHLHGNHHHIHDPHRHEGKVTSKQHVHDDDERHLLRAQVRQRHHQHEDARDAPTYKSQQALHQATIKLHEYKRRPQDKHHQEDATATTTTTSASSPSAIKASLPLDVRHLCLLPMSLPTLTSSTTRRPPQARVTLPSSEAPQGRWPSMGISLRSWRRATRCHIIWASNNKTTTRRLSKGHPLRPWRRV